MKVRHNCKNEYFGDEKDELFFQWLFFYKQEYSNKKDGKGERKREVSLIGIDIEIPECTDFSFSPWRKGGKSVIGNNIF